KAKHGTRVVYVPGNHDEAFRDYVGLNLGGIELLGEAIHETADGRRLLVLHGDEFDGVVLYARWLAFLGDWSYRGLIALNTHFNRVRRMMGLGYWSVSAYLKHKVKDAVAFIDKFEGAMADEARRRGVHGVICGHIHKAEMREIEGVAYLNDGDWVESCTAIVEGFDGAFKIVHWLEARKTLVAAPIAIRRPLAA
ncbi:MAG TPA: UDP-2,3-diacylglucosamine diphosphatase, partial [Vineibacter sp.]|nr:UDP-2,3-diacylglucosamine diphosphatase [Vineibacter sp.]